MTRGELLAAFGIYATAAGCAPRPLRGSVASPRTYDTLTLRSRTFPSTRAVRVFVPAEYASPDGANTRYPAFVFTDGLTVFRTEKLPSVVAALERARKIRPTIFVGVDNGSETETPYDDDARSNEYLPYPDLPDTALTNPHGRLFPKFLFEDVMPLVRARYRVSDEPIGLGGFSYGALAALWTAMSRPGEISRLLLESGPFQISHDRLMRDAKAVERWPAAIDIGIGTAETGDAAFDEHGVALSRELAGIIRARGSRVRLVVDKGAEHDPVAWAKRLPGALQFLARLRYIASFTVPLCAQYSPLHNAASAAAAVMVAAGTNGTAPSAAAK